MTPMLLAAVAALCAGTGVAYQQRAASEQDPHAVMDPRLVLRLVRQRRWLVGICIGACGFGFQAVAISSGQLVLVEPILAGSVLVGLLVSARLAGRRLGRTEWSGVAVMIVGMAGFIAVAAPSSGGDAAPMVPWAVPLGVVAACVVLGRILAGRLDTSTRALTLGLLAGLTWGTADAVIKVMSDTIGADGWAGLGGHWSPWVWLVLSPGAFLMQQSAFHAGHLGAALPATASLQPLVASLLGVAMLGERVRAGWAIPVELAFAGLILWGIIVLARSPLQEIEVEAVPLT